VAEFWRGMSEITIRQPSASKIIYPPYQWVHYEAQCPSAPFALESYGYEGAASASEARKLRDLVRFPVMRKRLPSLPSCLTRQTARLALATSSLPLLRRKKLLQPSSCLPELTAGSILATSCCCM